jgi:hypothetical protein
MNHDNARLLHACFSLMTPTAEARFGHKDSTAENSMCTHAACVACMMQHQPNPLLAECCSESEDKDAGDHSMTDAASQ